MRLPQQWTLALAIVAAVVGAVVQHCGEIPQPEPPREECPPCDAEMVAVRCPDGRMLYVRGVPTAAEKALCGGEVKP